MSETDLIERRIRNHAEEKGYTLGRHSDKIIAMIVRNNGECPCKKDTHQKNLCPCPDHAQEIKETGHCTCTLFHEN